MNRFRITAIAMSFLVLGRLVEAQVSTNWTQVTAAAPWSAREYHEAVVLNGLMWVLGGYDGGKRNDVWSSPDGLNWTQVTAAAPWGARNWHAAVALNGLMWVLGGDEGSCSDDVWSSPNGLNWTQATAAAPWSGRCGHAAVVLNGSMWVLGGFVNNGDGGYLNDVWSSPDGINWTQVTAAAPWSARRRHAAVVLNGSMWVLGGYDGSLRNDVWSSPDGINWTRVTAAAPWSAREYHEAVVLNGLMWVFGGDDGSGNFNDVWSSPDGINWTQVTAAAPWSARGAFGAVVFDGQLWVMGGNDGSFRNDVWSSPQLPPPVASFTAAPTNGFAPLSVTFTDTSTGTVTSWFWNFGDGGTTNLATSGVVYTYKTGGVYTVTEIVTGPGGVSTNVQPNDIVVVNCPTITLSPNGANPTVLTGGTAGTAYSQTITANGGIGTYTYATTSGTLPTGLSLSSAGVLSGTPTSAGTYTFTVTATDTNGCTGSQAYSLTMTCPTITLSPATLFLASAGVYYSQTITASGGNGPYSYAKTGTLPTGMALSSGGVLSGISTETGTFPITIRATDQVTGCTGSRSYTLRMGCPIITLSPSSLPAGTLGSAYSATITGNGGLASYAFWVSSGSLPTGLNLDSWTGVLSGIPTAAGPFTFTVAVYDENGCPGAMSYTVQMSCPTVILSPAPTNTPLSYLSLNTPFSTNLFAASGGSGPYTFAVSSGVLPNGVFLSSSGGFSGTASATGSYTFAVQATDTNSCSGAATYTVIVGLLPSNSTNSWINASSDKWEVVEDWSAGMPNITQPALYITNGSTKTVTIDATTATSFPSTMTVINLTIIGSIASTNTLLLSNAGMAIPLQILGGALTLDTNAFMVVNNSAVLAANSTVTVGYSGADSTLIVSNGGALFNGSGYIGYGSDANNNTAIISGSGSVWSNGNDLIVGHGGYDNQLIITNGGTVFNNNGYLSYSYNSAYNSALVTGPGSVWANQSALVVGEQDDASLKIANGGAVYSTSGYVGSGGNPSGAALVTGSGSVWDINGGLSIGAFLSSGQDSLTIANGGAVFASDVIVWSDQQASSTLLVSGTGSVCSISGDLEVYDGGLTIANGGVVYSGSGHEYDDGSGTSILVTDSGSVWYIGGGLDVHSSGGASMTIANGGVVCSSGGIVGANDESFILVTGTGSVWSNSANLSIGNGFEGDESMTITNGGAVYNANAVVDAYWNSTVVVSGPGSLWNNSGNLSLGGGDPFADNQLTITDGGSVFASNVYASVDYGVPITVSGGALYVTNALGNGVLNLLDSTLTLNGGTVAVDSLVAVNGANSVFTFNSGFLISGGTFVTNNEVFVVGDGTDAAKFQLNGGVHSFANNLEISNHATLSGCGTVNGNVVVDPGGRVLADCGDTLNFTGIVTNNGNIYALDGTSLNFYGPVVNNGLIDASHGHVHFWSGVRNNGTIVPDPATALRITSITREGNDIRVTWICEDGNSYALQSTRSTAMIAGYNTNFADASPIIIASGVGLFTTNYLDVGAAYTPVLTAPGGTMVTTSVVPSTVSISAAGTRGITDSLGFALPIGNLVMLGTFSISESTIQSNFSAGNVSAIMSNFTLYGASFKVGDGTGLPATWDVSLSAVGFGGQKIYLLVVDTPTLAKANHLGIYTAPSWVFADDGNEIDIDLADVTGFVIGAQGGSLTINLPVGGETYTFNDTAKLSFLPGRVLFYRVRLAQ